MDAAVNLGPAAAVRILQHGLNRIAGSGLAVDGILGPITTAVASALDEIELRLAVKEALIIRAAQYARLAKSKSMQTFLRGWILRTTGLSGYLDDTFFKAKTNTKKNSPTGTND